MNQSKRSHNAKPLEKQEVKLLHEGIGHTVTCELKTGPSRVEKTRVFPLPQSRVSLSRPQSPHSP